MQEPALFCSLHNAFGPQGDGLQGFIISWIGSARKNKTYIYYTVDDNTIFNLVLRIYLPCFNMHCVNGSPL